MWALYRGILIAFGEFGYIEGFGSLPWLMFFVLSIFVTLVMMNLLIAITSDTFTTFQEKDQQAANSILAEILLELETFLFWRRNAQVMGYVVFGEYDSVPPDQTEDELVG